MSTIELNGRYTLEVGDGAEVRVEEGRVVVTVTGPEQITAHGALAPIASASEEWRYREWLEAGDRLLNTP